MIERRLRPISRLISCVRPPIRPLTDSRSLRVLVARGSIAYSVVTQPRPDPLRQRGTPTVTLAATRTRVCPYSTSTEPSAWLSQLRVNRTSRSWSRARPSAREVMAPPYFPNRPGPRAPSRHGRPGRAQGSAGADPPAGPGNGEGDGAVEVRHGLGEHRVGVVPRRDVGE